MKFQPGTPKPANSGRKKGTPNKLTKDVAARLAELRCDPIEGMAKLAMDKDLEPALRGRMFAELAQYIKPKLRATEHRLVDHEGNDRSMLSPAELLQGRMDSLAERIRKAGDSQRADPKPM